MSGGIEAVYAFKDISLLRLNSKPDQMIPGAPAQMKGSVPGGMPQTMQFQRLPNGIALLTLTVPWEKKESAKKQERVSAAPTVSEKDQPSPEQLAQAIQMFKGMRISLAVEPQGKLVITNSPYVAGNRVTLFEMDMEEILAAVAD